MWYFRFSGSNWRLCDICLEKNINNINFKKMKKKRGELFEKKGQIWIETVIYLLIAFVMIGMVLAFVKPKIEEIKDESILDQSVQILGDIEDTITSIGAPGNKRLVEIGLKKGTFTINSENDSLIFKMDSMHLYTEPGVKVEIGSVVAETTKKTRDNLVVLSSNYTESYNFTYNDKKESKILTKASVAYKLVITNEGYDTLGRSIINFELS